MLISAAVLAFVSLSTPTSIAAPAAYAGESVMASKGHAIPARPAVAAKREKQVACHPDPSKGRACRHNLVQAEQAERPALAVAEADVVATKD